MTDFISTEHPRAGDGTFATKAAAESPELDLTNDEREARRDRRVLLDGLDQVHTIMRHNGGVTHPDLARLRARHAGLAAEHTGSTKEEIAAVYVHLETKLEDFAEEARKAYVARDVWAARGSEGEDPITAFGPQDWADANNALDVLKKTRADATGAMTTTDFQMYSPAGDAAVKEQMDILAARIDAGVLHPGEMRLAIKVHVKAAAQSHPELHDTEPEWAIVDALNPLLERRGYDKITPDDLG